MKKFSIFIVALTLAIGFSAFIPNPKASTTTYYWLEGVSTWHSLDESEVCTPGSTTDCYETIGGSPRQIFKSQNVADPLKYD